MMPAGERSPTSNCEHHSHTLFVTSPDPLPKDWGRVLEGDRFLVATAGNSNSPVARKLAVDLISFQTNDGREALGITSPSSLLAHADEVIE